MADNNTYTSKQNIKKYTTQAKFDAIDKSDVPVGTEYNIVGEIEEADLSSALQTKINSTTPVDQTYSATSENAQSGKAVAGALSSKQDKLVSGQNIKTINGQSVLGSGDIPIGGGGSAGVSSIGGKTGDIALGDGIAMRGNELYTSRPKFYKHFVRAKWLDAASITYQFYMTVLNTDQNDYTVFSQITVPGGCSTSITVALDSGNNNDPQSYVGCISAWMEENVIYFYYDGMMRSVARDDANIEFISDFIEELV